MNFAAHIMEPKGYYIIFKGVFIMRRSVYEEAIAAIMDAEQYVTRISYRLENIKIMDLDDQLDEAEIAEIDRFVDVANGLEDELQIMRDYIIKLSSKHITR